MSNILKLITAIAVVQQSSECVGVSVWVWGVGCVGVGCVHACVPMLVCLKTTSQRSCHPLMMSSSHDVISHDVILLSILPLQQVSSLQNSRK